jgi:AraC-like DNA-binding protein
MRPRRVASRRRAPLDRARRGLGTSRQRPLARAALGAAFVRFLRLHHAAAVTPILRDARVEPALRDDPDATVDLAVLHRLLAGAARALGDPAIGVRFAAQVPWSELGVFGFVLLHSPTLGAALASAGRYVALQNSAARLDLTVDGGVATVTYDVRGVDRPDQGAELTLAMVVRVGREAHGGGWAPREVHLRHRAPADPAAQRAYFAAPLRFGAPADALLLDAADLRRPMRAADPALLPILLRHADDCLARMPRADDLTADVRAAIAAALRDGDASIATVAAGLATTPRTLQRRLAEQGQRFAAVVDATRLALARRYLADPALTLTETAFLLGYHDLSAFSRAFRRWTGETALAARRRALSPPAPAWSGRTPARPDRGTPRARTRPARRRSRDRRSPSR